MTKKEFKSHLLPAKGKLFRLAVSMLGDNAEAEDTLQDVYLKLWTMRGKLTDYKNVEALAMTMTKNLCIDKLRSYRSKNKNTGCLEQVVISADSHDPAQSMEVNETLQSVYKIIARLPERQRLVLHLRDIEQYSYDEIEAITKMSRNNIRVTLSRARRRVREEYSKRTDYGHQKS